MMHHSRQCFHCDLTGIMLKWSVRGIPIVRLIFEVSEIVQFTHRYARYTMIIYLNIHMYLPIHRPTATRFASFLRAQRRGRRCRHGARRAMRPTQAQDRPVNASHFNDVHWS